MNAMQSELQSILDNAPKCKTIKDLRESPLVDDLWKEDNDETAHGWSWWLTLKEGFCLGDGTFTLGIHEYTIKEMCHQVNFWVCVDEQHVKEHSK
jgi:hypothetical protein